MSALLPRRGHVLRWLYALGVRFRRIARLSRQAAWKALVGLVSGEDLTHAAAIAYYALLSLFPFLLLIISLLASITADDDARTATLNFVLRYFPRRFEFVTSQLEALQRAQGPLSAVGVATLTWASLGVFNAVTAAVNHAWKVERQRSFVKHRLVAFLMLVAAGTLMILTLLLFGAGQVVRANWFAAVAATFPGLLKLGSLLVSYAATLFVIVAVGLIFYFVPNAKTRFRDVWIGAVLTGLLWRASFAGFSWFVRDMSRFSIHGSIGAVVVFLLWVYVSAVILLYGVEFTAAYSRLLRGRPDAAPAAPAPRE